MSNENQPTIRDENQPNLDDGHPEEVLHLPQEVEQDESMLQVMKTPPTDTLGPQAQAGLAADPGRCGYGTY